MAIRTELSLRIPNSPGALATVTRLLANERVNVAAMSLDSSGLLRMLVDNHVHAGATLRDHHYQVAEREVIVTSVPNTAGALAPALRLMSDAGVNVEYAYSGAGETAGTAAVVIGVERPMEASAAAGI